MIILTGLLAKFLIHKTIHTSIANVLWSMDYSFRIAKRSNKNNKSF